MQKRHETTELCVIGAGVTLEGVNFYCVPSQAEPGRVHLVRQLATRLNCDCRGYQYRGKCCHVDAVKAHKKRLQLETAARDPAAALVDPSTRRLLARVATDMDANAHLSQTPPRRSPSGSSRVTGYEPDKRDTAILRRSQQPFSILK